jgi:sporulation protein YabP
MFETKVDANKEKKHAVKMTARKGLELSGVLAVDRFDRERFDVQTDCGHLHIQGQQLHIKALQLEHGLLVIEGTVNSLVYHDGRPARPKQSLFAKMFQ